MHPTAGCAPVDFKMTRTTLFGPPWRLLFAVATGFLVSLSHSQPAPTEEPSAEKGRSHVALTALGESFRQLDGELKLERDRLKKGLPADEKSKSEARVLELGLKRDELLKNLEFVITGIDSLSSTPAEGKEVDLEAETRELLMPIVQELKQMTASPREAESLRRQVTNLQQGRTLAETAVKRLNKQIENENDATLKPLIGELLANWQKRQNDSDTKLAVAEFRLEELEAKRGGVIGALRDITSSFFKRRGSNLLIALCVSLAIFGGLRLLWHRLERLPQLQRKNRTFSMRMVIVAYHVFTILLAIFSVLLVFYLAGDWVLLGIAAMFLIGIAWTGKQTLPIVYEQLKMLLNLGAVREGERVIYHGIPWQIQTISIFSELRNPELDSGSVRLPLRELTTLISRPSTDELWFPCAKDDWVLLSDGTHGKVVTQSPEWVQLVLLGGSRRTYPTPVFLELSPENLSHSFRVQGIFGIDYEHQALSTTEIPAKLQEHLERELRTLVGGDNLKNVSVELSEAASSSLNYTILADFSGEVAKRLNFLQRAIQRLCVNACNEHGWAIPFTQITLHQAKTVSK